ncbi:MAG: hypothetical protein LBG31_05355 [Prevotellaceae bacterium]|jgi:uncharacterized protein (TIGR02145 family)|nr:hypothetical protein [Prevotellaceae bacterium]
MRTTFFLFAMLASVMASAQTTVQIMPVSATYTTTPTIQFKVSWTNQSTDNHRNKVWLFVDFQPVISPAQKGNWQPATITGTVQKTAGTVSEQSDRGFFLEGATTDFSATVTVQLSNTGTPFNWCAYASDCPPNIGDYDNGTYTLRGTPPFTLIAANGTTQTVPDKTIAQSALTITPVTMTDATGCPGHFCKYIGRDLYVDATHKCDLRASGAKNWEAYIKDTRDNEYYRIILMPDTKWWLAQNVKYAQTGTQPNWCNKDECGRYYSHATVRSAWGGTSGSGSNKQGICPPGWVLPIWADYSNLTSLMSGTTSVWMAMITPLDSRCPINEHYGWNSKKTLNNWGGTDSAAWEFLFCNDAPNRVIATNDIDGATAWDCGRYFTPGGGDWDIVRCYRP